MILISLIKDVFLREKKVLEDLWSVIISKEFVSVEIASQTT